MLGSWAVVSFVAACSSSNNVAGTEKKPEASVVAGTNAPLSGPTKWVTKPVGPTTDPAGTFAKNCAGCHGKKGVGGKKGPKLANLPPTWGLPQLFDQIANGKPPKMPAFKDKLSKRQIEELCAYVYNL